MKFDDTAVYMFPAEDDGDLRIYSSMWCRNHYELPAYNHHMYYHDYQIWRGYRDRELTRPTKIYFAIVEGSETRSTILYGESLEIIKNMLRMWDENRLRWAVLR